MNLEFSPFKVNHCYQVHCNLIYRNTIYLNVFMFYFVIH